MTLSSPFRRAVLGATTALLLTATSAIAMAQDRPNLVVGVADLERGDCAIYLRVAFKIQHISDSPQLMELELICEMVEGDAN